MLFLVHINELPEIFEDQPKNNQKQINMDESQLLNHLINLENSSQWLEIQIQLWHDGEERDLYIKQKSNLENEIEDIKTQLINVPDKTFSLRAKQHLIDQLREYKNQIRNIRNPYRLLPIESINIENSLFSNLDSHIKAIANGKQWGIHIPILNYTREEDGSTEIESFLSFIDEEIEIIRGIENLNFVTLKAYHGEFQARLINKFIN